MEWKKFQREELRICRRSSLCLTTSERDKDVLREHIPSLECQVIPNGVDSLFFRDPGGHVEEGCIVFTGTISYFPNLDGVLYFVDKVFPLIKAEREHVKFYIVGKDPPEKIRSYASSSSIIVTGTVEDVRPYLSRAQVVVAPLRIGGGTRLKILEALAMGKAVVATSLAAEGLELVSDEHLVIADDPRAFARTVVDLLGDEKLRARLGANGRKVVEERYDWRSITRQLEAVQQAFSRSGATNGRT
jgi:glycosyltransferase involved in cell wall biosynthesis